MYGSFRENRHKIIEMMKTRDILIGVLEVPQNCKCLYIHITSDGTISELWGSITLVCAHVGRSEIRNLNLEFPWQLSSRQGIPLVWLKLCRSISPLWFPHFSSSNLITRVKASCWSKVPAVSGPDFTAIAFNICEERWAGSFQTKMQPSPPTWNRSKYHLRSETWKTT